MTTTIRRAVKKDYPELVEIMEKAASGEELRGFVPPRDVAKKFLILLRQQLELEQHRIFVAEINRSPVGFIFAIKKSDCFDIEEIDVAKEHQCRGIGRALVNMVERLAEGEGVTSVVTGTSISREGRPWKAYGFWINLGYEDTGERTDSGFGFKYCKLVKRLH